jgi:drug/metabolite transporter (DMT)-like permease
MAEEEYRDKLPEDLDVTGYVGPYHFPNNNRRRISAAILGVVGLALIALYAGYGQGVLVNRGFLVGGILMLLLAGYHLVAGATLRVSETDALIAATRMVGFPIGHASAQLSWRGLISRPTWRILLYSADEPPTKRGLVLVSGVTGEVGEQLVEDNPEDWSDLDR